MTLRARRSRPDHRAAQQTGCRRSSAGECVSADIALAADQRNGKVLIVAEMAPPMIFNAQYEGARRPRSRRRRSTGVEEDKNAAPHGDSAVLNFGPCTDASSCSYYPGSRGRAIVTLEAEAPGAAPSSRSAVRCS